MCTLSSIRLLVMVLSWFKLIFSIYVFYVGCYFASSTDLQHAFGMKFLSYGLSLIFLALLSGGIILPHRYGVRRHNRFIMAVTFFFDTIVFCELISIGYEVQGYTYPWFSKGLQLDCLRNTPIIYSAEECHGFYDSSRTAGFRLFWEAYFTKKADKFKFQVLSTIEGDCCGFYSPFNCLVNTGSFPKNRLMTGIDKDLLKQKVECGAYENYYPETDVCADYYDFSAGIVGGCNYDLGVGFCLNNEIDESSIGCASATEDYVVALIAPHSVMLMACSSFNFIFMLFACCMWWKRKETDIFPEFVIEHNTTVQYDKIKDQFVVIPKKNLLQVEGYLPQNEEEGDEGQSVENSLEGDENNIEENKTGVEMNSAVKYV